MKDLSVLTLRKHSKVFNSLSCRTRVVSAAILFTLKGIFETLSFFTLTIFENWRTTPLKCFSKNVLIIQRFIWYQLNQTCNNPTAGEYYLFVIFYLIFFFFFRTEAKPEQRSRYCYIHILIFGQVKVILVSTFMFFFYLSLYLIGKGAIVAASVVPGIVVFSTIFLAVYFARKRRLMAVNNGNSKLILKKLERSTIFVCFSQNKIFLVSYS